MESSCLSNYQQERAKQKQWRTHNGWRHDHKQASSEEGAGKTIVLLDNSRCDDRRGAHGERLCGHRRHESRRSGGGRDRLQAHRVTQLEAGADGGCITAIGRHNDISG